MWDLFLDKGSNLGLLLGTIWSQPLDHEGSPLLHSFNNRKQGSIRLHGLPEALMGSFKQLFIREGQGCKTREKRKKLRVAWGKSLIPSSRDAHNIFELLQIPKPLQVGEFGG